MKASLNKGDILYTTKNNIHYRFVEWTKNNSLKFLFLQGIRAIQRTTSIFLMKYLMGL